MLITVDFDKTLTRTDVQRFVIKAIKNGHTVIVVTSRNNEFVSRRLFGENDNGWNSDVVDLATRLGCSKIYFTNEVEKYKYIAPLRAQIHLDDVKKEVSDVNSNTNTLGIWVNKPDWEIEANKILNKI